MIGPGTNHHHLIYVDDLCEALTLAALAPEAKGEVFVAAGKDIVTTNEMVATVAAKLDATARLFHAPLAPFWALATILENILRPLKVQPPLHRRRLDFFRKSFAFSQDKARNVLGFEPRVSFREGAAATADWYRQMGYL
jgi:nucleoside-diphosphate-sugar epimerase